MFTNLVGTKAPDYGKNLQSSFLPLFLHDFEDSTLRLLEPTGFERDSLNTDLDVLAEVSAAASVRMGVRAASRFAMLLA